MTHGHHLEMLTLGVEEEFVLVDPITRVTAPRAPEVISLAAGRLGERVAHELYATQVEAHTRPIKQAQELRKELMEGRRVLAEAAMRSGCEIVASGAGVLTSKPFHISEGARYAKLAERYPEATAGVAAESNGCHVHVGELDRGEAVTLANHLRPWLPVLQALAVNSPFAGGAFRRVASWRHFQQQAWPTVGPMPAVHPDTYEEVAADLVDSGVLVDRKMIYWYSRPSEHQPTLEIRVADVNSDVDVPLLGGLLTRALSMVLLLDVRRGEPAPPTNDAQIREDHRQAAAHGLSGAWRHPLTGQAMTLSDGLGALVEHARPALEALDEVQIVDKLLRQMFTRDTGARRQRAVYRRRGSLQDVVDELAAQTIRD